MMYMNDEPTLTLVADGVAFSVQFDRWDALQNDRARWHYRIHARELRHEASDLSTVGEPRLADALSSLLTFVSAAVESRQYRERTGHEGENEDLFPAELLDVLSGFDADEITLLAHYVDGGDDD
jgi:hypothetical protein